MSNPNDNKSDLQQAVDKADAEQIDKNLQQDKSANTPDNLSENEKTSFIDEQSRTDK